MRKTSKGIMLLVVAAFVAASVGMAFAGDGKTCSVVKTAPNPVLVGEWSCVVTGNNQQGRSFSNPVSYRLEKVSEGCYALYYSFRPERGQGLEGYQDGTINGNEVLFKAPSGNVIKFVASGSDVYFVSPMSGERFKMTKKLASN